MVIGITGSIASGKSIVTNYLISKGYNVIDCDEISHNVLELNEVKEKVNDTFLNVLVNNKIDRKKLGLIVFNNLEQKKKLENITMPYIVCEIKKEIENKELVFLDAPTLLENKLNYLVDKLIVIKTSKDNQIKRLMLRDNITYDYAIKKINAQWPIEEKLKYANYVIDNDNSINDTYLQVDKILNIIKGDKK